ncbi:MAG: excinuclease ABC subunit UvrC [Neisseriales bacterium]|nr:MAG: excinuclease ABC subunit UvrC [Neisseriales bacterium]
MLSKAGKVLYVGKAVDLKRRVKSYFQYHTLSPRIGHMMQHVGGIDTTVTRSETEALLLEYQLIQSLLPRYNILFRDDKSYPYLRLSSHEWPQLSYCRDTPNKCHQYFGPFPHSTAARTSMEVLQRVFQLRTCHDTVFKNRSRPCLLYQIKYCSAPCTNKITHSAYQHAVRDAALFLSGHTKKLVSDLSKRMHLAANQLIFEEATRLRNQIQALTTIQAKQFISSHNVVSQVDVIAVASEGQLTGINLVMIRNGNHLGDKNFFPLHANMVDERTVTEVFLMQHYTRYPLPDKVVLRYAPSNCLQDYLIQDVNKHCLFISRPRGEKLVWLQMAEKNIRLALTQKQQHTATAQAKHDALQAILGIYPLERIECFDVSHTQGEATMASCVVYDRRQMQRSEYRSYRICNAKSGDDYGAMREVLQRRYARPIQENTSYPDAILIDGGQGQVAVALEVLQALSLKLPVIGIAKAENREVGKERLILSYRCQTVQLPADHLGFLLLQLIRDEAHRFAVGAHRRRRAMARRTSCLENIVGIGPKRRQLLLTHFEGLKGVTAASVEDIAQINQIGHALAEKIYQALHE